MTEDLPQPPSIEFADVIGELFEGKRARDRRIEAINHEIDAVVLEGMREYLQAVRDLRLAEAREKVASELARKGESIHERADAEREQQRARDKAESLAQRVEVLRERHKADVQRLQLLWRIRENVEHESQEGD